MYVIFPVEVRLRESSLPIGEATLNGQVVTILERARANVVRSINSQMVIAYWLMGREIVEEE